MATLCYLCHLAPEPLWTNHEKERFWSILETYFSQLLFGEIPLPDSTLKLQYYEKTSTEHRALCRAAISEFMWSGRYSSAISNFKAMRRYFDELEEKQDENRKPEMREIKEIFMERPLSPLKG